MKTKLTIASLLVVTLVMASWGIASLPRFANDNPRFPYWPEGGHTKQTLQRNSDGSWIYPQYHPPNNPE